MANEPDWWAKCLGFNSGLCDKQVCLLRVWLFVRISKKVQNLFYQLFGTHSCSFAGYVMILEHYTFKIVKLDTEVNCVQYFLKNPQSNNNFYFHKHTVEDKDF